jgi:hypothetical protein
VRTTLAGVLIELDPERLPELACQLNSAMEARIQALSMDQAKGSGDKPHLLGQPDAKNDRPIFVATKRQRKNRLGSGAASLG